MTTTNSQTAPNSALKVNGATPNRETVQDDLELASRHVIQGRNIVARQQQRIARLKTLGCSTANHEETLKVFLSSLEIFVEHERQLREHLALRKKFTKS